MTTMWEMENETYEIDPIDEELIGQAREFLQKVVGTNIDWDAPGMEKTPERFARMLRELTTPITFDFTLFPNTLHKDEMVIVDHIPFTTLCEHHIIPFRGYAHIAYIPVENMAGLSKFARCVQFWSKGLWTQEALTDAIADQLADMLDPLGLAVILEAEHMCMTVRGVQSPGTMTTTSCMQGVFLEPTRGARAEFLQILQMRKASR